MTNGFVPIVVLAVLAGAFAVLSVMASALLGPKRPLPAKIEPYESGIQPVRLPGGARFPVKFYVVAMLFIIFDVETIFLFPWAVAYRRLGLFGLGEMAVFIGLVFVAYLYIWQKGGLEWEGPRRPVDGTVTLPAILERGPGDRPLRDPAAVSGRSRTDPTAGDPGGPGPMPAEAT